MRRFIWAIISIFLITIACYAAEVWIDGRAYEKVDVVEYEFGERMEQTADDVIKIHGTGGLADTDLSIDLDGLGPVLYSQTDSLITINDDFTVTGSLIVSGGVTYSGNLSLDDGAGDSPVLSLICQGDKSLTFQKLDSGEGTITNNEGEIYLLPSNDTDDYLSITTASNVPTIATVGNANLTFDILNTGAASTFSILNSNGSYVSNLSVEGTVTGNAGLTAGLAGTDGLITVYSEQGATDYSVTLNPNASMTSVANFYLPADEPAATGIMTVTTGGVLTIETASAGLLGALSDETGSGVAVFATSPALVTPNIGAATAGGTLDMGAYGIQFEGASADEFETVINVIDPTTPDKAINFPNASGTVAVSATAPVTLSATGDVGLTVAKDIVASGTGMSGGADDVLPGADADVTITLATAKDIVAGTGLTGGENDVLPGADADTTISLDLTATNVWTGAHSFQSAVPQITLGKDETGGTPNIAGQIKMFSTGDNAYYTTLSAPTNTSNAAFILPVDEPAGTYLLNMTTGGQIGFDSSVYLTTVDISANTNLTAGDDITLTDDDLDVDATVTRDIEWDTLAEINTASTDADILIFQNIAVSGQTTVATDVVGDTLTLAGGGITAITTNATTDTITFTSTETDPNVDTEAEIEAITGALFGASKAVTSGYIWVADGTDFESVPMSGDVSIASGGATTVADDSHAHTTTTISGLDVSADTNLAVTTPIVLTDDTLSLTVAKDIVAGVGLSGGEDNVLLGADADTTLTLDLTEINSATFGSGTFTTLTFDAGASDPVLTFGSGTLAITGTLTATNLSGTNTGDVTYTAGDALTLTGTDFDFDGGATPSGELGGTWASPTIDDSLAVTSWSLTTPTIIGGGTFNNATTSAGFLDIYEDSDDGVNYTRIQVPAMVANITYTLPPDDGTNTYVLQTDGTGGLTWVAAGAGDITTVGSAASGDAFVDGTNHTLTFEGATVDTVETIFGATDPTVGDQTFNLPDMAAGGTYTLFTTSTSLAGDVTGTSGATIVGDDSHAHTTTSLSGIDISADTNLTAGRSLTLTDDDVLADAELYTDTKCIRLEYPIATDDLQSIWIADGYAVTLTRMWGESDQTVVWNFQVDDGTPADVSVADLTMAAGTVSDTTLDGDTTMAAGDRLDLKITSVTNTPTWATFCFTMTCDD